MKYLSLISRLMSIVAIIAPGVVMAQGLGSRPVAISGTAGGGDLFQAIQNIVNVFLVLVAIVAALFVIIGGVQYITSRGDTDQAETAKRTILYAVIGLIVIGLSTVLVNFVFSAF